MTTLLDDRNVRDALFDYLRSNEDFCEYYEKCQRSGSAYALVSRRENFDTMQQATRIKGIELKGKEGSNSYTKKFRKLVYLKALARLFGTVIVMIKPALLRKICTQYGQQSPKGFLLANPDEKKLFLIYRYANDVTNPGQKGVIAAGLNGETLDTGKDSTSGNECTTNFGESDIPVFDQESTKDLKKWRVKETPRDWRVEDVSVTALLRGVSGAPGGAVGDVSVTALLRGVSGAPGGAVGADAPGAGGKADEPGGNFTGILKMTLTPLNDDGGILSPGELPADVLNVLNNISEGDDFELPPGENFDLVRDVLDGDLPKADETGAGASAGAARSIPAHAAAVAAPAATSLCITLNATLKRSDSENPRSEPENIEITDGEAGTKIVQVPFECTALSPSDLVELANASELSNKLKTDTTITKDNLEQSRSLSLSRGEDGGGEEESKGGGDVFSTPQRAVAPFGRSPDSAGQPSGAAVTPNVQEELAQSIVDLSNETGKLAMEIPKHPSFNWHDCGPQRDLEGNELPAVLADGYIATEQGWTNELRSIFEYKFIDGCQKEFEKLCDLRSAMQRTRHIPELQNIHEQQKRLYQKILQYCQGKFPLAGISPIQPSRNKLWPGFSLRSRVSLLHM